MTGCRVENEVHLPGGDSDDQGVQRIMLASLRSESVREPEEVLLVDRVQDSDSRPLDDLVLKGGNREWALPTVRFGYVDAPGRLAESDFPRPFIIGYGSSPSRCRPDRFLATGRTWDLPVPVQRASTHARFFDHAGSSRRSR